MAGRSFYASASRDGTSLCRRVGNAGFVGTLLLFQAAKYMPSVGATEERSVPMDRRHEAGIRLALVRSFNCCPPGSGWLLFNQLDKALTVGRVNTLASQCLHLLLLA